MKRTLILLAIALIFTVASIVFFMRRSEAQPKAENKTAQIKQDETQVAAPGLIEPVSEEIEIGSEISGKLKEVRVEEGDEVHQGQVIAVLINDDYQAQLASVQAQTQTLEAECDSAKARLLEARATLDKTINGARTEERREAHATVEQSNAIVENAEREVERRRSLYARGDIAREELERAERDLRVAQARRQELSERFNFVNAKARTEDIARARASVQLAQSQVREAEARIKESQTQVAESKARLEKTFIRSPINGVVLRKRLKAGESMSPESANSSICTIADTSRLRVRTDVDETDVSKIKEGQRAYITADAYGSQKFWGRVVRISQVMGRKNLRTEEPTEKVDKKILETLIELDGNTSLPPGLRVNTFIIVKE